ncbi:NAD-dependent epimerase [Bacteroidota bacterium]
MKILVTGTAGFIGYHTAKKLLERGDEVVGLDNVNDYYDVNLKYDRLAEMGIQEKAKGKRQKAKDSSQFTVHGSPSSSPHHLITPSLEFNRLYQSSTHPNYRFIRLNLEDRDAIMELFEKEKFDRVIHLAAQAGVRYSIENPWTYIECNIIGHLSILEACRNHMVEHLVYASSSSVYGNNTKLPLSVDDNVDHPISLYAATKKADELMSHTYSHLYGIPTTGLRFFTVYGPWGRPDMALFIFTKAISEDRPIDVYNNGEMWRDFTYVGDIVEGIVKVLDNPPDSKAKGKSKKAKVSGSSSPHHPITSSPSVSATAPYRIYNIGCSNTEKLLDFIHEIEKNLGKKATMNFLPLQPGDVPKTFADVEALERDMGYKPSVKIQEGVMRFVEWYREYYLGD